MSQRTTTNSENLRILAMRLSEHLSPAEKQELERAAVELTTREIQDGCCCHRHIPPRHCLQCPIHGSRAMFAAVQKEES